MVVMGHNPHNARRGKNPFGQRSKAAVSFVD